MDLPSSSKRQNPFLSGNWAPLDVHSLTTEEGIEAKCIFGEIPSDLQGSFLRVGPSLNLKKQKIDLDSYHIFAGDGLIVGLEFKNNTVRQRCRWILAPSDQGIGNTAMVFHSGRLLTLSEGSKPWEVSLPKLETVGMYDFNSQLNHNCTAHPKVCAETNELIFFGYSFGENDVRYTVASSSGEIDQRTNSVSVQFRKPVMAPTPHDIAITRNYSIFLDFPLWDMEGATKREDPSMFGVLPRHNTTSTNQTPIWFSDEGQFGYHVANSFEVENENIIKLFMCTGINFDFRSSNKKNMLLREWHLDMSNNDDSRGTQTNPIQTDGRIVCDIPCEFPVIDERRTGLPFQYIWASCLSQGKHAAPLASNAILRYDVINTTSTTVSLPNGMHGGEARFVPTRKGDGTRGREGEGYLVFLAHDSNLVSYALIYDAMFVYNSKPIAMIEMEVRAPNGFHALWVDCEKYNSNTLLEGNTDDSVESRSKL
jgi:carotenoid cleavage dioxygenase-like enzyme